MPIKTALKFHFNPVKMAFFKETATNVCEDVEKKELLYTVGGNINLCTMEISVKIPQKTKNGTTYDPAILPWS
jgi:hypothetical protein